MPAGVDAGDWGFPNQATPIGSAAYYAVRFSPEPGRLRTAQLFAWYRLVQAIADRPGDQGAARLKLDWWREEITGFANGRSPRHPLMIHLATSGLSAAAQEPMLEIVDAAEHQVLHPQLSDADDFAHACRANGGNFFRLLREQDSAYDYNSQRCMALGAYCEAVERIRQLAEHPQRVPAGLEAARLRQISDGERVSQCAALARYPDHGVALSHEAVPDTARRFTALTRALHAKLEKRRYPVSDELVDRAPIAHLWTAWRCR